MSEENSTDQPKKKSNTGLIILVIVLVLCLGCTVVGGIILFALGYLGNQAEEALQNEIDNQEQLDNALNELEETDWDEVWETMDEVEDEINSIDQDVSDVVPDESEEMGTIGGSLSYPSEFIPEDMMVCAEDFMTGDEYCADGLIQDSSYEYGYGYEIEVPYGSYYVYAQLPGETYKAYYSNFVTCGMDVSCSSHDPILVIVDSFDDLVDDADPMDWYDPSQS